MKNWEGKSNEKTSEFNYYFGILSLSFCAIAQEEPVYLGTAIRSLSNPYHAVWADGATAFANSLGWKDYNVIQTCEGSSEKQLNDIKALVARSQGNVVFSIDPNQSTDAPAIANELEKVVFTLLPGGINLMMCQLPITNIGYAI